MTSKTHIIPSIAAILVTLSALQGCAAIAVADAAVGTTVFVAKTAVKGTVGATKLVYRGGKAVGRTVMGGASNDGPKCLNPDGSYSPAIADQGGEYYCG